MKAYRGMEAMFLRHDYWTDGRRKLQSPAALPCRKDRSAPYSFYKKLSQPWLWCGMAMKRKIAALPVSNSSNPALFLICHNVWRMFQSLKWCAVTGNNELISLRNRLCLCTEKKVNAMKVQIQRPWPLHLALTKILTPLHALTSAACSYTLLPSLLLSWSN